ncbi:MAG: L,D-transpeptidase [Hyphomicrobiaceae bacterium]
MSDYRSISISLAVVLAAGLSVASAKAAPPVKNGQGGKAAGAPSTSNAKPAARKLSVSINLTHQRMDVSYGGHVQHSWPISSGRAGYPTPRGTFRPQWASKMWYSRKYDNAPMPHAVFFNGGIAVHGTNATSQLGRPASHGCVRLAPGNAGKFYSLVHSAGFKNTRIAVVGTPPPTAVARKRSPERSVAASAGSRRVRTASGGSNWSWGWPAKQQQVRPQNNAMQIRRGSNGLYYLPRNSRMNGAQRFVYNGVVYERVR